jgi:hypothetical protein
MTDGMAQVVQLPPSKNEALSSMPSTKKLQKHKAQNPHWLRYPYINNTFWHTAKHFDLLSCVPVKILNSESTYCIKKENYLLSQKTVHVSHEFTIILSNNKRKIIIKAQNPL